jgi:hypothetical protein
MDLVATVSQQSARDKATVDVWRLNGQRVFGASFGEDDDEGDEDEDREEGEEGNDDSAGGNAHSQKVKGLAWRRDGEFDFHCSWGSILPTCNELFNRVVGF